MKKLISILLIFIMIFSLTSIFASCAKQAEIQLDAGEQTDIDKSEEKVTNLVTEIQTEVQAESETEAQTERIKESGGGYDSCIHTGGGNWNAEFHHPRTRVVFYIGQEAMDWFYLEPQKKGFDGIGEGSKPNLYDYIHIFNIPKEVTEFEYIYSYEGYYSVVSQDVIDMIYEDRAEDFENYFLNLGPIGGELWKDVEKRKVELQLFLSLFFYESRYCGEKKEDFDAVKNAVLERFDGEYLREQYPDYTAIYSIPEVVYLNGLTKEEVAKIFDPINNFYDENFPHYNYDYESIFTEREKFEKLIADARALEDPVEMLKATRAINESLRK